MKNGKYFNIRVYGLLLNTDNELLIAEEYHYNTFMRKLPGGGLQFGEGTRECLVRELQEELAVSVEKLEHFYTTEFFVQSAFNADHQVVGIYYRVELPENLATRFRESPLVPEENGQEYFRWVKLDALTPDYFTFPSDQAAIGAFLERQRLN
jgi:ADP-ribose pyrophosphatase YjhB (NUDIX family)